jgi:hypothetical protein
MMETPGERLVVLKDRAAIEVDGVLAFETASRERQSSAWRDLLRGMRKLNLSVVCGNGASSVLTSRPALM